MPCTLAFYNQYAMPTPTRSGRTTQFIEGVWAAIYVGIQRANILDPAGSRRPGPGSGERDQILGEAYFLRGLHYFNLVRYFGGVPVRTTPAEDMDEASKLPRATEAETYTQIISDLQQAEQLLVNTTYPNHPGDSRGRHGAARQGLPDSG
jgi:hypothetical protein